MKGLTRKRFSVVEVIGMMAAAVMCVAGVADAVTVPHTFVNGTVADAAAVNTNFAALVSAVNDLESRLGVLEYQLQGVQRVGEELFFIGVNVHIQNGTGQTESSNGLGNLIVGYNEVRGGGEDDRTGSHNIVVGRQNNYSSFGGLVSGQEGTISGNYACVSGGIGNTASGDYSSVSGGDGNTASWHSSSVSGGGANKASGSYSSVSGGNWNTASGRASSVGGGYYNTASGDLSSVSGGGGPSPVDGNEAYADNSAILGGKGNFAGDASDTTHTIGTSSTISGGSQNKTFGASAHVCGGVQNEAGGGDSSVLGGRKNTAGGFRASVSGGNENQADADYSSVLGGQSNTTTVGHSSNVGDQNRVYVDDGLVH